MAAGKEGIIEKYLCDQVKKHGGLAEKLVYQNARGAPDRWCFFPNGNLFLVECKVADGKATELQLRCLAKFEKLGFKGFVVYSKEDVDMAILCMLNEMREQNGEEPIFSLLS